MHSVVALRILTRYTRAIRSEQNACSNERDVDEGSVDISKIRRKIVNRTGMRTE